MLLTIPNILTLFRIGAIPVIILLMALVRPWADLGALLIYISACVTDYLDGELARRQKIGSEFGRVIDPVADKLLVGCVLLGMAGFGHLRYGSLYAALLILFRETLIGGLRDYMSLRGLKIHSSRLAKWKTGLQMTALGFLIAGDAGGRVLGISFLPVTLAGSVLLWLAVIPTWVTGWQYLRKTLKVVGQGNTGRN